MTAAGGRISPFLLPAATTSRFLLLVVITLWAAGSSFDQVLTWLERYTRCNITGDAAAAAGMPAQRLSPLYLMCVREISLERAVASLAAMAAVTAAVVLLSLVRPRLTRKRQNLRHADPAAYAELHALVSRLARAEGVTRPPILLLDPNRGAPGGRAFGSFGRTYLRLNIGTLHRARKSGDSRELRAVVMHELAHVRNRDIELTTITLASVWVFCGLVAPALVLHTALREPGRLLEVGSRTAAAAVLVLVLAAAVLRARESYADVRVVMAGKPPALRLPRRRSWVQAMLPLHPADSYRAAIVQRPGELMRWLPAESLGAGLAFGIGTAYLTEILQLWFGGTPAEGRLVMSLAGVLNAVPCMAIVLAGAYRAALRAMASGARPPYGVLPGCALGTGLLAGLLAAPSQMGRSWLEFLVGTPLSGLAIMAILLFLSVMLCRWSAVTATVWLPVARARSLRPAYLGALIPAALVSGLWLSAWIQASEVAQEARSLENGLVALGIHLFDVGPLTALLVAVLYPLAAWFRHREPSRGRALWLDTRTPAVLPATRIRPLAALVPPAMFALSALAAEVIIPGPLLIDIFAGNPGDDRVVQAIARLTLWLALMDVLAALTAATIGGMHLLGFAHATLAAVTTGLAVVTVLLAEPILVVCVQRNGCLGDLLLRQLGAVWVAVTAVGVAAGLLSAALAGVLRVPIRLLTAARRRRPPPAPRSWLRRTLAIATLAAAMIWPVFLFPIWTWENGLVTTGTDGRKPDLDMRLPPPRSPGLRAAQTACPAPMWLSPDMAFTDQHARYWATTFVRLAESDRPFLVEMGRAGYARIRDRSGSERPFSTAATRYCRFLTPP
ncbi:M48 family metalloprotease [Nonomuraea sp. NPDC050404]|uniref:M48 family metalloprotease n=1 Tax=Nonomuraea sp. NPDC050404 TaxID=3155783 RepID=UPI00340AB357